MAKNYIQEGKTIDFENKTETKILSGDVVIIGDTLGVSLSDIEIRESGTVALENVFELPKENELIEKGQKLYFSVKTKKLTTTPLDNVYAGIAFERRTATEPIIQTKLNA